MESTKQSSAFEQGYDNSLGAPDVDHNLQSLPPPTFQLQASEGNALQLKDEDAAPLQLAKGAVDNTVMPPALVGSSDAAATKGIHKTKVTYATDTLKTTGETVGVLMEADPIGPDHPQGSSPNLKATAAHMAGMKGKDTFIRGHLLNHDIGGPGVPENLFPITAMANSQHYHQIEKHVVRWVNEEMKYVYYKVEVKNRDDANGYAEFHCEALPTDAVGNKTKQGIQATIISDPGKSDGFSSPLDSGNTNAPEIELGLTSAEVERVSGKVPPGYDEIDQPVMDLMVQDGGTQSWGISLLEGKLQALRLSEEAIEDIIIFLQSGDELIFERRKPHVWNGWIAKINSIYPTLP